MSLVDRMIGVHGRVYGISDHLGVKQHVDFSFKDRLTSEVVVVIPRPRSGSPPPHKLSLWQQQNVEVNTSDVYVTGISRLYVQIKEGATCLVNGKPHTILWIDNDQSVTYSLLVRPERSR